MYTLALLLAINLPLAEANETASPAERLAQAHHALRFERWDETEQILSDELPPAWAAHGSALLGMAQLEKNRAVDAVQSLQRALASRSLRPPLRHQAQLHLGISLLQIEDADGAWETLLDLLESDRLSDRARLPQPDGVDPGEIRWQLAQVAVAQKRNEEAQRQWEALWTQNPTSSYAPFAKDALEEAGASINLKHERGQDLMMNRVRSLEKLYRYKEALTLREKLPDDHRLREPHRFAAAVFKAKDYARASELLGALPDRSPDEGILLALAQVRSGEPEESLRTYKQLAKGSGPVAELAQYKVGYMAWDQGQWSAAIEAFGAYLRMYPNGKHADTSLWFTAMAQLRFGANAQARNTLERLQAEHPRSSLRIGARYWSARLQPNPLERERQLHLFIQTWPTSGYAWFASQIVGHSLPTKPAIEPVKVDNLFDAPDWDLGVQMAQSGLETWARPHLESLISSAKQSGRTHRLALANALVLAGSYQAAKRLAQPWCGDPAKADDPMLIQVCWPRPSGTAVRSQSVGAGLPDNLPFAIMTAESALDPGVTSPAGARGLMQLMPAVAKQIHEELYPEQPFDPDSLFRAASNANLGTTELTRLAARFRGAAMEQSLPLVIAGYNGGPKAVQRWLDAWATPPRADEWAEFIGYSETRRYVRRVLGYLQTYQLAYGETQPAQASESSTDGSNAKASSGQD